MSPPPDAAAEGPAREPPAGARFPAAPAVSALPAVIVLSAGASRRMGRPKALLALGERSFVHAIVATALTAGARRVLVVLGPPHGTAIAAALAEARLPPGEVATVWNATPERGMLGSVQAALARLLEGPVDGEEAALIWPVDLPRVAVGTLRLLAGVRPLSSLALPVYQGRGGHPLRLPRALFAEALALPVDAGLMALRQRHAANLLRLPLADPGVVGDSDTPEEYRARFGG